MIPQTGYLTPDSLPDGRHCRTFTIPDDVQWLSVFMGALIPLIYPESWRKYGLLDPDEAADAMLQVIWDAYENDTGQCLTVEAPFWDEISEAEDTYPPADQPWYGLFSGATFTENLENWTIASFIAYSGNVGAAVQFLTIAPAFRLAWKSHDLGGLVRVIVDSVEMGRIDTYSATPGEVYLDIAELDPGIDEHELLIVLDELPPALLLAEPTAAMQLVRKKLDPGEVIPPGQRYSPDDDCVEVFNGTSWSCSESADPRHNRALLFPPNTAPDPQCQAAANMSRYIEDFLADITNTLGWATVAQGALSAVLAGVAILFPPAIEIGLFAFLALDVATVLFSAGVAAIEAAFTPTVYDQLTCIFYCHIDGSGQLVAGDLEEIKADIDEQIGGLVSLVTSAMFLLMGEVGLSNAGATGDAPADCDACDCGWCYQWLPSTGFTPWAIYPGQPGALIGDGFETGLTFAGGDPARGRTQVITQLTGLTPGIVFKHIRFDVDLTQGNLSANTGISIWINNLTEMLASAGNGLNGLHAYEWDGSRDDITSIQFVLGAGGCDTCGDPGGYALNNFIQLSGSGDLPGDFTGGEIC